MLLQQKVMLISREVIERARQRDEQTEVLTEVWTRFQGPQYVLPLTMALLTSYTVNARYAESAFGRLTTRAIKQQLDQSKGKDKGIRFIVLYPPKRSHDLLPLAGLYTRKPFQSPGGYSRTTGSI